MKIPQKLTILLVLFLLFRYSQLNLVYRLLFLGFGIFLIFYWLSKNEKIIRKPIPQKLRYEVMRRDKFKCVRCGRCRNDGIKLQVDHIKPLSKGGKTEIDNLQTLCFDCNIGKGNRHNE